MQYKSNKKFINFFIENREIAVTSVIILLCLLLSSLFPSQNSAQLITRNVFFLVIVPILYYKLILKKKISDLGLNLGDKKRGVLWGLAMLAVNLLIFFLLYTFTDFKNNYFLSSPVVHNFAIFLLYELVLVNAFSFIQEFFWRGFVLLSFLEKINYLAIFLQFIIYVLILILSKNSFWQMAPTLVISLTSGIIVYKNKSIFYSWIIALTSVLILDSFVIYHLQ